MYNANTEEKYKLRYVSKISQPMSWGEDNDWFTFIQRDHFRHKNNRYTELINQIKSKKTQRSKWMIKQSMNWIEYANYFKMQSKQFFVKKPITYQLQ